MDTKSLRARALSNVRVNWGLSIGAAIMAWMLAAMGTSFIPDLDFTWTSSAGQTVSSWTDSLQYTISTSPNSTITIGPELPLNLAQLIIGGVIQMGYCVFLLKQHDGRDPEFRDLFSQFDYFGTGFAQKFLRDLYTFLWGLLLIIPGIVASYSYAMTPYILAENPTLSANEAISRSKEMMDGHKSELFMLHLTFIGWDILAALTLNIGHLWLNPYRNAADAAFYRELQNRPRLP